MTAEQSKELLLSVQGLKKNFGEREILKGIDFDVHKGDVVCVIGPSGSGKSTLIRCVNYLEQPTDGVISYRGENVLECFKNLPLYRTKVGMVFQQFNLFNNMTVLENCVVGQVKVLGKKSGTCWYGKLYQCKAASAFRRSEAACGYCQSFGFGAGNIVDG